MQNPTPTDTIITTMLTLRHLQKQSTLIPPQIRPMTLPSNTIKCSPPQSGTKLLLISNRNIVYYGTFDEDGYPSCQQGVFVYSDGVYFVGGVRRGRPEGRGRVCRVEGANGGAGGAGGSQVFYEGEWLGGVPHGEGREVIGENCYMGNFDMGKKQGKGKLKYGDGSVYEGNFHQNTIEGQGKYFSKNNYWEGKWKDGYLEGNGRQIISKTEIKDQNDQEIEKVLSKKDTSVYVGEFLRGEKSGFGTFRWNKNYEYEGKFQKGQLHGEGTFKFKGKAYAGVWANGTEVKVSELIRGVPSIILKSTQKNSSLSLETQQKQEISQIHSQIQKSNTIASLKR